MVIESKLDPGRGAVVTCSSSAARCKVGDALVAGAHWGRVRAMHDYKGNARQGGAARRAGRGPRLRLRPRGRRVRARGRERPHGPPARRRARARASRPRRWPAAAARKVSLEDDLRPASAARAVKELNLVLKADVSGSLEAFEDEIAKLPQDEVQVDGHPLRRRRHHRVRRQPRRRVRRGRPRLQRPPGRRGAPARRPRGRRDPHLLGHLPRDRRAARRHAGHARAGGGRGDASATRRGPRRSSAPREIGTIAGCYVTEGKRHARRQGAPRARRHGRLRRRDRLAAALQRRRARGRRRASSAASCSRTSRTSRKAT